jgi:hypothetical protein
MVEEDFVCRDWAAACRRALKRNFGGLAEAYFRQSSEAKWYTHYIARHLLSELTTAIIGEIPCLLIRWSHWSCHRSPYRSRECQRT